MKKIILFLFVLISVPNYAQKPIFVAAKVKAATVYFNAAELVQTVTVNLPVGTSEIVVKNVADYLNESTVQIATPKSVTILSIQFSQNYLSEYEIDESNPTIKKVRDSINWTKNEIKKTQIETKSNQQTIALLDANKSAGGANNGINVVELAKLLQFYKAKRTELDNAIIALQEKETKLNTKLKSLNDKLATNVEKEEKISKGKLIIQVMNEVAGTVNLAINYITDNASWRPFYDLRAENIAMPLQMLYKAQVEQNTGIDWKKVNLSLSSGNPNQNNEAPILNSWFLRYQNLKNEIVYNKNKPNASIIATLQGQLAGINITSSSGTPGNGESVVIRGNGSINGNTNPLYIINGSPSDANVFRQINPNAIKSIKTLKSDEATSLYGAGGANGVILVTTKQMDDYTEISENQLNTSFEIDIPYDILSNGKPHSVVLKEIQLPVAFKYYAAPKLEKEAFLLAEIKDYAQYNLLAGEANIIFEGLYVGKTQINPNQTNDTLSLSIGRDKKITVKREKVIDKSGIKFLSSKKEQTFTYDITVRNNKKEAAEITIKDQYPLSTDKEIEIELLESNSAKDDKETGILSWNLKLNPNETKKLRISYKVKYPKDKIIDNF